MINIGLYLIIDSITFSIFFIIGFIFHLLFLDDNGIWKSAFLEGIEFKIFLFRYIAKLDCIDNHKMGQVCNDSIFFALFEKTFLYFFLFFQFVEKILFLFSDFSNIFHFAL